MDIDETEGDFYELIPDMAMALRVNPDTVHFYINEQTTLVLDQDTVDIICKTLEPFRT